MKPTSHLVKSGQACAARLLAWRTCWLVDQEMDSTPASSISKVFATEMAKRVCRAIQILGDQGYTRDGPLEKHYRGVKASQIYEGTIQIQRIIIGPVL